MVLVEQIFTVLKLNIIPPLVVIVSELQDQPFLRHISCW